MILSTCKITRIEVMHMDNKRKVGRPKLADTKLKKKSLIISGIMVVIVIALILGGLINLNIMPKFGKLKGEVICSEIPDYLQPYDEVNNPNGLHEYGFTDINFYSAVVNVAAEAYCSTITEEQLASIPYLYASDKNITDANGIQYLKELRTLELDNNKISSIDLTGLTDLWMVRLNNNDLNSIDLTGLISIQELILNNNNLSSVDLTDLSNLEVLFLSNNNLDSIDLTGLTDLNQLSLDNNNLSGINLSDQENLELLLLQNNSITNVKYILKGNKVEYKVPIILNEQYEITYEVEDEIILKYQDNTINTIKEGTANIKLLNDNIVSIYPEVFDFIVECDGRIINNGNSICTEEKRNELEEEYNLEKEEDAYIPYFLEQEIKVYDIESKEYNIDKDKKEIDVKNKELDVNNIILTLEGLSGIVEDNNYVIKDGETIVDTYKLINIKKEEIPTTTTVKTTTTTKKVTTTNKRVVNKNIKKTITTTNTTKENIINKIIPTTKKNTTSKVITTTKTEVKDTNKFKRFILTIVIIILLLIGYIGYKKRKNN